MSKFTIPTEFMGVSTEDAYKRVLEGTPKSDTPEPDASPTTFNNSNIVRSDYIKIPETKEIISRFELPGYNNMNWENTNFKLHDNGLYMPTIPDFMKHFLNVIDVFKSKGKKSLLDANGNPVSEKDTEDIYKHLTTNHLPQYGGNYGTWTWLDGLFRQDRNSFKLNSEHRTSKVNGQRTLTAGKSESLESCLSENKWAGLKLNRQGLPVEKSSSESNRPGENFYFWTPVANRVARFDAYSGRADLDCYGGPSDADPELGVYAVAQGV